MKTLLILAPNPELIDALRAGLDETEYKLVHRLSIEEAEPLLAHGLAEVCIVDAEFTDVQALWTLERLRRRNPRCPIIVYSPSRKSDWEESAYLQGATHILNKPVRVRALMHILARLGTQEPVPASTVEIPVAASAPAPPSSDPGLARLSGVSQTLSLLRDFSSILSHSLNAEGLTRQFLLLLREIIGVNRAAVFLRGPTALFGTAGEQQNPRLHVLSSLGIPTGLLEHLELSLDSGIGGLLARHGRIVRRESPEAAADIDAQKEFQILGSRVAVPIMDRDAMIGVAVFDGRLTGEPLQNAELELTFHLLEQIALGVRNIWMHEQMATNHELLAGALRELGSACVVVNSELRIVHANKVARKYFGQSTRQTGDMEFTDLPSLISTKVYQVLKTGAAVPPFRYEPEKTPGAIFSVSVVPFQRSGGASPASVLLTIEDLTQSEQLRKLEVETAGLRLVKTMADRLVTEIGNAMVPISTHQQLLSEKYRDAEFRASLEVALAEGVKRVTRLVNTMRFLACDSHAGAESFPLPGLIDEAFQEARKYQPAKASQLKVETHGKLPAITGDRAALKHAFTEVLINALQANPTDPRVGVHLEAGPTTNGQETELHIDVQDNGAGFSGDIAHQATSPFYTTRVVGLGLGLTVSRKIIETHRGRLEIVPSETGKAGLVRIALPLAEHKSSKR